ncbi:chondroitinase-B domain-containing protein [Mucilaginibacter arboris]|uniref:Chloramphenicol resistance protein n=1 Tax=Mucilaginibacter arboris TaxID=2682090 RepID=A0A7K1ST20_9SPHI|nr:chondroitinase-B domain-containing protein [Mucilaginibacter arboris]MVN20459.1 chloramphenicol resistance protein [Mucilaginibacter arboris]
MNKRKLSLLLIIAFFFITLNSIGQIVSSKEEIYKAVAQSKPGDEIKINDREYKDIQLMVTRSGNTDRPIIIKALNPGKVYFTGDAKVELRAQNIILAGIWFKDGNRDVNKWKSHGPGLVAIYGSYNRVTECVFDCFDEANSAYITTSLTKEGSVPQHCRIDHCVFTDKITFDQVINLNNTASAIKDGRPGGPPMYHRVDHCFFSNPQKPGNAGGAIRIGYYRNDMGRCLVDSNLFQRQDSEAEIITSKSQENVYYANTCLDCQGTMNFRHGDHQIAINNFYIGNDTKFGYGGMFVWGSKHIIACNYFELPETIDSRGNAALYLNPGPENSEHALAFNLIIANNIFKNINGYAIHFNPLYQRRVEFADQNKLKMELPHDLLISGNIFYHENRSQYTFFKDDFAISQKQDWKNNFFYGSEPGIPAEDGLKSTKFKLAKNEFNGDAANLKSIYKPSLINGIKSIEGIDLDIQQLVDGGIKGKPLTWNDVRPNWLKEIPGTYALTTKLSPSREVKFKEVISREH